MGDAAKLVTTPLNEISADWLIIGLAESSELPEELKQLDLALGGGLTALQQRGDLTGKASELNFFPVTAGLPASRLLLVGLGRVELLTIQKLEHALLAAFKRAAGQNGNRVAVSLGNSVVEQLGAEAVAQTAAFASLVASTGPGLYKAEKDRFPFKDVQIHLAGKSCDAAAISKGSILGQAVNLTRDLVNRHPEEIYPETFAARAQAAGQEFGFDVEIFDEEKLREERMGSLLAVSRGSAHEPRAVIFRYNGAGADAPLISLIGKGVTFDSGGLSIKPSDSMITMKGDMAGAATVLGAVSAIASLKLPVNVFGMVGLVENMLGAHAYKLGEVLTARNGTTIEVHNTDAEGRLVLADILAYASEQKPAAMIDLATLTGACVVALGMDIAGAFTNNQSLCDQVLTAARQTGEEVWQLPMNDSFNEQLKCEFADVKNVGTRWGGAITAAKFLERFVNSTPWVHLDIAGPAFAETSKPYRDLGGTGAGVRTLVELVGNYKSK